MAETGFSENLVSYSGVKMSGAKKVILFLLLMVVLWVLAACGRQMPPISEVAPGEPAPEISTGSESNSGPLPPTPENGPKTEPTRVVLEGAVLDQTVAVGADSAVSLPFPQTTLSVERSEDASTPGPAAPLMAGEVDDNAQWDDYLLYLQNYAGPAALPLDVSSRYHIWVTNDLGHPVVGAPVKISANGQEVTTLRTHSDGRVYFFPHAYPIQATVYQLNVTLNGQSDIRTLDTATAQPDLYIAHLWADLTPPAAELDILFLLDTTGSMTDEIAQLTDNIRTISAQIDALPVQPDVRFALVAYRDQEDVYVTQVFDFTPDIDAFAATLSQLSASGGGDYPEDLNEALWQAIHQPTWRLGSSVSLIFLVADAPPHLDYGQENHYAAAAIETAETGIKIYPIASSGLDVQGEYIFRQLAQFSGGRFIFLTYGAEGAGSPGSETSMNVTGYTVSALDQLVVQIVQDELAFLRP